MKKSSKIIRIVSGVALAVIFFAAIPLSLLGSVFLTPSRYDETYYGELTHMVRRLKDTEGKRIIFVGNSAMAFGILPELIRAEIPGYTAVVFGLYGAIGTKAMINLSKAGIREGDIVTAINGEKICSIDELNTVKNQYAAGDEVTLTVYRSGTYYEVTVTLIDQATGK